MVLNSRNIQIVNYLLMNQGQGTINGLMDKFKISKRTLYYDLGKINYWLKSIGVGEIEVVSGKFTLDMGEKKTILKAIPHYEENSYEFSKEERKAIIALNIFLGNMSITIDKLTELLKVSRNTVVADMNRLRNDLGRKSLQLKHRVKIGYYIKGREIDIRNEIMTYIYQIIKSHSKETMMDTFYEIISFSDISYEKLQGMMDTIKKILEKSEIYLERKLTDNMLEEVVIYLLIIYMRSSSGEISFVDQEEKEVLKDTEEFKVSNFMIKELKENEIIIAEEEAYYLTMILLGSKIINVTGQEDDPDIIRRLTESIVTNFEQKACVRFVDRVGLIESLLLHIKPMYYRLKYGITMNNPLNKDIKQNYTDLFNITRFAVIDIEEKIGKQIPSEEIAYIAIHFGGWLKREGIEIPISSKKILIVCPSGIGTSMLIKEQVIQILKGNYSLQSVGIRTYEKMDLTPYEFVISTNKIKDRDKKVIIVNPIFSSYEKSIILTEAFKSFQPNVNPMQILNIIKKYATIKDEEILLNKLTEYIIYSNGDPYSAQRQEQICLKSILKEKHLQIVDRVEDWETAIELGCGPLVESNIIDEGYSSSIKEIILEKGLYFEIMPRLILAHAKPDRRVKEIGISIMLSREEISFTVDDHKKVNCVLVLAAIDNQTHFPIIKEIFDILSDETKYRRLIEVDFTDEKELFSFLNEQQND